MNILVADLRLGDNLFTGRLPWEYGKLNKLQVLALNGNPNVMPMSIPTHYGDLLNLEVLQLSSVPLLGNIPTELAKVVNLGTLTIVSW